MSKVVIDMTMSLDGFMAGPGDGKEHPLGLAPYGLGDGVRLLDHLGGLLQLEKLSVSDGPLATHFRYRVAKS